MQRWAANLNIKNIECRMLAAYSIREDWSNRSVFLSRLLEC